MLLAASRSLLAVMYYQVILEKPLNFSFLTYLIRMYMTHFGVVMRINVWESSLETAKAKQFLGLIMIMVP